jgi:hypothetical protein
VTSLSVINFISNNLRTANATWSGVNAELPAICVTLWP